MSEALQGIYTGPFGVDMMIVAGKELSQLSTLNSQLSSSFLLHPCVELNLRRTMGHVALSLAPQDDDIIRVMRIEYLGNKYQMKIQKMK